MRRLIPIMLVATLLPQMVFAAWWNPFSWRIFQWFKSPVAQVQEEVATTTVQNTKDDLILCNGQYWNKCPSGQLLVCPEDAKADAYCSTPKTPKAVSNTTEPKTKQSTPTTVPVTTQAQVSSPPTEVKNYYYQTVSVIKDLISEEESFVSWLKDTNDQFRTAVIVISNKPYAGGMVGDVRDAAVASANAQIGVINSSMSDSNKYIAKLQAYIDSLSSTKFVGADDYSRLPSIDTEGNSIESLKKQINEALDGVLATMRF